MNAREEHNCEGLSIRRNPFSFETMSPSPSERVTLAAGSAEQGAQHSVKSNLDPAPSSGRGVGTLHGTGQETAGQSSDDDDAYRDSPPRPPPLPAAWAREQAAAKEPFVAVKMVHKATQKMQEKSSKKSRALKEALAAAEQKMQREGEKHEQERKAWAAERAALQAQVDQCRNAAAEYKAQLDAHVKGAEQTVASEKQAREQLAREHAAEAQALRA